MHPIAYVIMTFGAVLALLGIVLFAKKGSQGSNTIKALGFEFQLAGSSLVIFVVGAMTFLVPILYSDKFPQQSQTHPEPTVKDSSHSEIPQRSPTPKQSQTHLESTVKDSSRSEIPQHSPTPKAVTDPPENAKAYIAEALRRHRELMGKGDFEGAKVDLFEYRARLESELETLGFSANELKNMTQREITVLGRREGLLD